MMLDISERDVRDLQRNLKIDLNTLVDRSIPGRKALIHILEEECRRLRRLQDQHHWTYSYQHHKNTYRILLEERTRLAQAEAKPQKAA